jgi:hypothetical protein
MVFTTLVALSDDAKASATTVVASLTTVAWIRCQKVHVDVVLVCQSAFTAENSIVIGTTREQTQCNHATKPIVVHR